MTAPFDTNWLFASVLLTTPILYAAVGELISQRAGVMNIGLEGMMLTGAFVGYVVAEKTGDTLLGLAAGVGSGIVLASVMAFLSVYLRANQIIVGVGLNILAFGYTAYLLAEIYPAGDTPQIHQPGVVSIPLLSAIPVLGEALFEQSLLVYGAYAVAPLAAIVLYRTRFGLGLRASGELPAAAESAGVSATRMRSIGVLTAGGLAGLGGAYLSIGDLGLFRDQMTAGRGFLAFAAVIFGGWRPAGVLAACTLFGMSDALQLRLQADVTVPRAVWLAAVLLTLAYVAWTVRSQGGRAAKGRRGLVVTVAVVGATALFVVAPKWSFPTELWLGLPYVLTLLALAGFVGHSRAPRALGIPYDRLRA